MAQNGHFPVLKNTNPGERSRKIGGYARYVVTAVPDYGKVWRRTVREGQMERVFTAVYEKHGKWYVGYVEEIPGVNTQGKNLREVKKNLREALELILETNRLITDGGLRSSSIIREPLAISQ